MRNRVNEYDKVIFICSKNSLSRPGVLNELEETLQRETREGGKQILIPINIDDYVFKTWNPDIPGLKQTILDRVVANFKGTKTNKEKFLIACNKIISALDGLISTTYILFKHTLILDESGSKSRSHFESRFIPYLAVDEITYSNIIFPGPLIPISTNLGIINVLNDANSTTLITKLDNSLPPGKIVTHIFEVDHINSFLLEKEDLSFHTSYDCEEVIIDIYFPNNRRFRNEILKRFRKEVTVLNDLIVNEDHTHVNLSLRKPKIGEKYTIIWEW